MKLSYLSTLFLFIIISGFSIRANGETPLKKTYITGHWNYPANSVQTVKVFSEGDDVALFLNGVPFGHGKRESDCLFTFEGVIFQPGALTAVSYDWEGHELSRHTLNTAGVPAQLILKVAEGPEGFRANGSDMALLQFEITDFQGKRCGDDDRMVYFEIEGPAEWVGAIQDKNANHPLAKQLKAEHGTNRALIKSSNTPGEIKITAKTKGLASVSVAINSTPADAAE